MSSRTLPPLRVASRHLRLSSSPRFQTASLSRRSVITASKTRSYAQASMPAATTAAKAAYSPRSNNSATTSPASKATPTTSASTPTSTSTSKPTPRTPVPAVSGTPLPDAASTTPQQHDNGNGNGNPIDWTQSFHGLGTSAFTPEVSAILQQRLDADDIEVKPDGIIYLPEIKYRRILNAAFGPGGWGLAPRGELTVHEKLVTREYALIVHGR